MSKVKLCWAVLGLLYMLFFGWYTSFEGPLTQEEIAHYLSLMERNSTEPSPEREAIIREFLESDTGDDFVMWNSIEMHDVPMQIEGVQPGDTSADVMAKYMEFMLPALLSRACHPVIMGSAASGSLEMFGVEGLRRWTTGAGMRYRSRRDMLEIATNPAFQGPHEFKIASINKTFAYPIDPWYQLGDPRLVLALVFLVIGLTSSLLGARSSA